MSKVNFFTPIKYNKQDNQSKKTFGQTMRQAVDHYFYLGGKKAYIIDETTSQGIEKALVKKGKSSFLLSVVKVGTYCTLGIPAIMLIAKCSLRWGHKFKAINVEKKLGKGIDVTDQMKAKLAELMPVIQERKDHDSIEWLSRGNNLVFKLKESPNLIFKIAPESRSIFKDGKSMKAEEITRKRFSNMIKGKEVCIAHQLKNLIVPQAKKIEVETANKKYGLVVEKAFNLEGSESIQEELYETAGSKMRETARQLAIFIAKTGFNDVTWRNVPVVLDEVQPEEIAIGLIDIEDMASAVNGFVGDPNSSRGLIRCMPNKEMIDVVLEEAKKQGVKISKDEAERVKNLRLKELETNNKLKEFYVQRGIQTGKEPIQIDITSLGLDLTEKGIIRKPIKVGDDIQYQNIEINLEEAVQELIKAINKKIAKAPDQASLKSKRNLLLNTNHGLMAQFTKLGLPKGQQWIQTDEDEKKLWINRIIKALVDKGHLFELQKVNGHGYFIQA